MTKNKAYFIKQLCELRDLDPESEEAKNLYSLKIVDLLIEIKKATPPKKEEEEEQSWWSRLFS
jgi:hypothetical protein